MDISEQLFERAKRVLPGGVNSPGAGLPPSGMASVLHAGLRRGLYVGRGREKDTDYICSWGPMILGHTYTR